MSDIVDISTDMAADYITLNDIEGDIKVAYTAYVFRATAIFQALYNSVREEL